MIDENPGRDHRERDVGTSEASFRFDALSDVASDGVWSRLAAQA